MDWNTNLAIEFYGVGGLGNMHKGFYTAYQGVEAQLNSFIDEFRAGSKGVVFAG